MTIPNGYKLLLVKDSVVIDSLDLEGYDLDKPMAKATIIDEIKSQIEDNEN